MTRTETRQARLQPGYRKMNRHLHFAVIPSSTAPNKDGVDFLPCAVGAGSGPVETAVAFNASVELLALHVPNMPERVTDDYQEQG